MCFPRIACALFLFLSILPAAANADVTVMRLDQDAYSLRLEMEVAAPPDYVRGLLTDYNHLGRVNPSIRESRLLAAPAPALHRVRSVTRSCVAIMCFDMTQVQDVEERADGEIIATIVPGACDFKDGVALWRILPSGSGTHVILEARMRPNFWVPPLLGTWMIERQINQQLELTVRTLNRLGREVAMR